MVHKAQRFLFSAVALRLTRAPVLASEGISSTSKHGQMFLEILLEAPHLAEHVRALTMMIVHAETMTSEPGSTGTSNALLRILPLLHELRSLEVESYSWECRLPQAIIDVMILPSVTELRLCTVTLPLSILGNLPGLRKLSCHNAEWIHDLEMLQHFSSATAGLETLKISTRFISDSRPRHPSILTNPPLFFDQLTDLIVVDLYCGSPNINVLLQLCKETLQSLEIYAPGSWT